MRPAPGFGYRRDQPTFASASSMISDISNIYQFTENASPIPLFEKGDGPFWATALPQAHNLKVIGSNPIPATTFIIIHSPSRSNRRNGFTFLKNVGGWAMPRCGSGGRAFIQR